ncbi:MAG TPA: TlpA disulfide reductase family protein [Rhizomicrobium sp.]|jgi:thiol-disulfide isomerase/thioredoxin|nr:TlpA disulfide reductase family protein [Rhizomicrobium sp.]
MLDRRLLLGGMAGVALTRPALADDANDSPIAHGLLAKNPIARSFISAPDALPDILVDTLGGTVPIGDILKGRTVLMPVWAEWCVPCLIELPDFARLQQVYGKDKFAILPVLSGTRKQFTPAFLADFYRSLNAGVFAPMLEHRYGDRLLLKMARQGSQLAIPCNILIGPDGKVVAREIGLDTNGATVATDPNDKYSRAEKAAAGETQSLWGTAAGDEFATAMAMGFLTGG